MSRKSGKTRNWVTLTTYRTADLPSLIWARHVERGDADAERAAELPLFKATQIAKWERRGLIEVAKRRGCSMSAVVRAAIDELLAKEGIRRPEPPPTQTAETTEHHKRTSKVRIEIDGETATDAGLIRRIFHAISGQE